MPQAVTVSFRLGGVDGVSVEQRKWEGALHALGFETRRIAGEIEDELRGDDVVVPALAITPGGAAAASDGEPDPATIAALRGAIDGADLLVIDNICSLPLNVAASRAVALVAADHTGRVVFRHHDMAWQRRHLTHLEKEFPPRDPIGAMHATVNLRSRRELEARGYAGAVTLHNYFDLDAPLGDRDAERAAFGFEPEELVVFHPARAIERKNVPGGIRLTARLAELMPDRPVRYWLTGPAEDGYAPTLERVLERATVPVTVGRASSAANGYAASDVVAIPSTWEGFGNPTIESIWARRACAAFSYPVLAEILATGVRLFSSERPDGIARFLHDSPEARERYFDVNVRRARLSYDLAELPAAMEHAFAAHGWMAW